MFNNLIYFIQKGVLFLNYVSVIDVGTSKIAVLTGNRGINNTLKIIASSFKEYAGYYNGEFVEPEKLNDDVCDALTKAEIDSGFKIKKVSSDTYPDSISDLL